jgi:hypothetical protein
VRYSERLGNCSPGWLCLRTPLMGTLEVCWWVCRSCYVSTVCVPTEPMKNVTIDVHFSRPRSSPSTERIPRMIHQTHYDKLIYNCFKTYRRLQGGNIGSIRRTTVATSSDRISHKALLTLLMPLFQEHSKQTSFGCWSCSRREAHTHMLMFSWISISVSS